MGQETQPYVFIIESSDAEDETDGLSEGRMLGELLKMMNKETEYRYIRTKKELREMARQFDDSGFRYLHIACHGESGAFHLALDEVSYPEFAEIVGPVVDNRRLFLSACSIAQPALARALYRRYRPYSITGPTCDIDWADAAVVWAALYRLLFKHDPTAIGGETVRRLLKVLCPLHQLSFVHFGRHTKNSSGFNTYRFNAPDNSAKAARAADASTRTLPRRG